VVDLFIDGVDFLAEVLQGGRSGRRLRHVETLRAGSVRPADRRLD
jgi:hypothetical protein